MMESGAWLAFPILLLAIAVAGLFLSRHILAITLCFQIALHAAALAAVAYRRLSPGPDMTGESARAGEVLALIIFAMAMSQLAVAVSIAVLAQRGRIGADVDAADRLSG